IGKSMLDFLPKDKAEKYLERNKEVFETGEGYITEDSIELPSGTRTFFINVQPVLDLKGNVIGTQNISLDITERKKAQQKLKESEVKFKALFKGVAIPSYTWQKIGDDFVLIDYNIAADKFTLGDIKNYLGFKASKMYVNRPDIIADLNRCLNDKTIIIREMKYYVNVLKKDINFIATYSYVPPDLVLVQTEDITKRKKTKQKLEASEERFRKAYKLAEFYKDLFAHDVTNILQSILLSVELCLIYYYNEPYQQKKMEDSFNIIKDQVKRGAILISNARKLSKIEKREIAIKSIELCHILKNSIKFLRENFQKKTINIAVDTSGKELYVKASNLLLDVFKNILINAVNYNENLIVEILVRISKKQLEGLNYLKIEFIDNGIGIADIRKNEIFLREIKSEKSLSGIGLGLSLVKRIIESYNGQIWVEDRVKEDYSKGSNFVLLIPEA
ncbi:MAG: ATP-binding protein, partial [Promethearchaeota archaeon]